MMLPPNYPNDRPENILYRTRDADSDVVIVDFGMYVLLLSQPWHVSLDGDSAKHLHSPHEKLESLAGSFGYVAPEVLNRSGHGKAVDIWSIGYDIHISCTLFLTLHASIES